MIHVGFPFCHDTESDVRQYLNENGGMNEMTLPSRHRIRNSIRGGLRPSTLYQYQLTQVYEEMAPLSKMIQITREFSKFKNLKKTISQNPY